MPLHWHGETFTLPEGIDAAALLPHAVERGMAFVPGAPFFADAPRANTLRLSFVTVSTEKIEAGIAALDARGEFPHPSQSGLDHLAENGANLRRRQAGWPGSAAGITTSASAKSTRLPCSPT